MASKSLGILTLDLVARIGGFEKGMDKAARTSKKRMDSIKKQAEIAGKALAGMGAAGVAALVAINKSSYDASLEVSRLAQVSNAGTKEFQRYAAGAATANIQNEKLADIFKDMSDRVGDFLETGGGPMADFFENIAPRVGMTAQEFQKLSGPQALQAYFDALEDTNQSQSQMTFYMEAIASDATELIPLLRNGGAGFKLLGDEAERAGAIIGQDTLAAAQQMQATMFLLEQSSKGFKNEISKSTLPVLADLAEAFVDFSDDGVIASEIGESVALAMKGIASVAVGAVAAVQLLGKSIGAMSATAGAAFEGIDFTKLWDPRHVGEQLGKNFAKVQTTAKVGITDLEETIARYAQVLDGIGGAGDGGGSNERVQQIKDFLAEINSLRGQGGASGGFISSEAAKADQEALDAVIDSASAATKQLSEAKKASEEALQSVRDSLMSEEEAIQASYERRLKMVLENTREGSEARLELEKQLTQQRNQQLAELESRNVQMVLSSSAALFGDLADLAKTFGDEQSDTYKTLFALSKAFAIANASLQIVAAAQALADPTAITLGQKLAGYATIAGLVGNIVSTIASTQYAGAFDNGGTIPSGQFGIVGEIGPEIVQGPAHVTSRRDTAKLMGGGDVVVNMYEDASKAGTVNQREADGRRIIDVFVADIRSDGPASRAMQSTYGVQRRGT